MRSMRFNFSPSSPWFTVWVRWLPSYSLDVKSNVNLFVFTEPRAEHHFIQVSFNKNKVIVSPCLPLPPLPQSPQNCNQVSGHQFSLFIKFSFLPTSYFVQIVWILFDKRITTDRVPVTWLRSTFIFYIHFVFFNNIGF